MCSCRLTRVIALMIVLALFPGFGALLQAAQPGFDPDDAWFHDKYFDRTWRFTLQGDELLVRYEPQAAAVASALVESAPGLTVLHPVQQVNHHAHYRVSPGRDVLVAAADISAKPGVISAYPALVDDDGYTKHVVGHELTVRFDDTRLDDAACRSIIAGLGSEVAQDHWTPGYYTVTVPPKMTLFQAIRAYNDMEQVRFAEFSSVGYDSLLMSPDDTYYPEQWFLSNSGQVQSCDFCNPYEDHDINAEEAWEVTTGSPDVIIAVVDSGCDMDHTDIEANILPRGEEDWNFASSTETNPWDAQGHGSACCGIVAAVTDNAHGVAGIAHGCRIMPLKIDAEAGMNQNRADAINYAASRAGDFDGLVISCSWGMAAGSFTAVYEAIQNAKLSGCVVCFAAGNLNTTPVNPPSDSPYCIAVGATSPCDERKSPSSCDGEDWWGSNYGPNLDICAPGVEIRTTTHFNYYDPDFNGTSSSTPMVAAVAALVLSINPDFTPDEVQDILEQSAVDLGAPGFDNDFGWGRLDAAAAVRAALTDSGPGWCDDFDRPDYLFVEGWTEQSGNWWVQENLLVHDTEAANHFITYDGSERYDGAVEARVHYQGSGAVRMGGVVARYVSDSDRIYAKVQDNTGAGYFTNFYIYDSNGTALSGSGNFGTDPLIQLEFTAFDATFRIDTDADGVWEYEYPAMVDTLQSGLCGICCYRDVKFDDWCSGPAPGKWDAGPDCESWDGADVTAIDGWTEQVGDWSTVDGALRAEGVTQWHYITKDGSYQADGCIEGRALYSLGTGVKFAGLVARYLSPDHYIMFKVQDGGSGYFSTAFLYDSGNLIASYPGYDFGTEPMIRLGYYGTAVIAEVDVEGDGDWEYSFPAVMPTTGYGLCGVTAYSQVEFDDFCFGSTCVSYGDANSVASFDGVPDTYWYYQGGQNLGGHYSGLDFGPSAYVMEGSVHGYNDTVYPWHSFDAVLISLGNDVMRVDISPPTDHVGLWFTYAASTGGLLVRGYDAADTLVDSATGHRNATHNGYVQLNAPEMAYVLIEGPAAYYTIDDFEWNSFGMPETISASLETTPAVGTVPFQTRFTATLNNLYGGQTRRVGARIDITTASGAWFPNWRAGYTNLSAGGNFSATWLTTIPALGSVIGDNTFRLVAEDVTPAPYNQPPYPAAGDTDTATAVVQGVAP